MATCIRCRRRIKHSCIECYTKVSGNFWELIDGVIERLFDGVKRVKPPNGFGVKHLEDKGIVKKSRNPDNWRSSLYELTPKGCDLASVLAEIILWGGAYNESESPKNDTYNAVQSDRVQFEAAIRNKDITQG